MPSGRAGTGRRSRFRSWCSKERGGSSPSARMDSAELSDARVPPSKCRACPAESIDFLAMEAGAIRPGYELWRPNREKPEAQSARALVVFLLLVTAGLAFVIIVGGWSRLEGVKALTIAYAALYVLFAFLVARWNRGVLPVASALSIILAIFAGIAAPAWFDRAK